MDRARFCEQQSIRLAEDRLKAKKEKAGRVWIGGGGGVGGVINKTRGLLSRLGILGVLVQFSRLRESPDDRIVNSSGDPRSLEKGTRHYQHTQTGERSPGFNHSPPTPPTQTLPAFSSKLSVSLPRIVYFIVHKICAIHLFSSVDQMNSERHRRYNACTLT